MPEPMAIGTTQILGAALCLLGVAAMAIGMAILIRALRNASQ